MSSKNKMLGFGLCSTSNDWPSDLKDDLWLKCKKMKKGPLSHQKIKCLFLDCVQLLMIGQVIWVMNVDWNTNKKKKVAPMSSKIKCSSLDYIQLLMGQVIQATKIDWKCKKRPPKSPQKMKCLFLDYGSTSDDRLSNLSGNIDKMQNKKKKGPPCHQKIKCSFLDYIQLLMIGRAIWAINVNQNAKNQKEAPYVIEN